MGFPSSRGERLPQETWGVVLNPITVVTRRSTRARLAKLPQECSLSRHVFGLLVGVVVDGHGPTWILCRPLPRGVAEEVVAGTVRTNTHDGLSG